MIKTKFRIVLFSQGGRRLWLCGGHAGTSLFGNVFLKLGDGSMYYSFYFPLCLIYTHYMFALVYICIYMFEMFYKKRVVFSCKPCAQCQNMHFGAEK